MKYPGGGYRPGGGGFQPSVETSEDSTSVQVYDTRRFHKGNICIAAYHRNRSVAATAMRHDVTIMGR
eukprot:2622808-Pyramimonas_sp.AAC.1